MRVTVLWNWAWCPLGCRAAWTPCRASGRTRGTGLLKVQHCCEFMLLHVAHIGHPASGLSCPLGCAFLSYNELMTTLSTVSYINYGPFTSYAPTYDSSFANISKEDSDLIYSSFGDESSLQGSDRYVKAGPQTHLSSCGTYGKRHMRHSWQTAVQMFLSSTGHQL